MVNELSCGSRDILGLILLKVVGLLTKPTSVKTKRDLGAMSVGR